MSFINEIEDIKDGLKNVFGHKLEDDEIKLISKINMFDNATQNKIIKDINTLALCLDIFNGVNKVDPMGFSNVESFKPNIDNELNNIRNSIGIHKSITKKKRVFTFPSHIITAINYLQRCNAIGNRHDMFHMLSKGRINYTKWCEKYNGGCIYYPKCHFAHSPTRFTVGCELYDTKCVNYVNDLIIYCNKNSILCNTIASVIFGADDKYDITIHDEYSEDFIRV